MARVTRCELPPSALLQKYADGVNHTDCFRMQSPQVVTQAAFVEAFYTTWLFRLERWILAWAVSRPSTDAQARELAAGRAQAFAAWSVEARAENQLLMCDLHDRTRSWLMAEPREDGTRLHFGSAVVAVEAPGESGRRLGFVYAALLGFHKLYSIALLRAAASRLRRFPA